MAKVISVTIDEQMDKFIDEVVALTRDLLAKARPANPLLS